MHHILASAVFALVAAIVAAVIDANSLTLAEYAALSNAPLIQRVIWSFLQENNVLNDVPLMTVNTMVVRGTRFSGDTLPAPNWAKLNEEPVGVKSKPAPYDEQMYLVRNSIDIDNVILEDRNTITDPRGVQIEAFLRGLRYDINDKFFNNDHTVGDPDAPVGLRARLDNPTTYGPETELKIDAGGVDLSGTITAANANKFLMWLDTLLSYLGASDGSGVVLYMNDNMLRLFAYAVRTLGAGAGFSTTTDAFGRAVMQYKGAIIRDPGRKKDQSTRIITNTETNTGAAGSSTFTSIYGVRYGETAFSGWQFRPLVPRYLGLLNNGVIDRTVFDWGFGLMQEDTRAIGRLYNIKVS